MLSAVCLLSLLAPQGGLEEEPSGMIIKVLNVDHGSAAVIRAPNGTVHVIDAGADGQGNQRVNGAIGSLSPAAYGYTFVTHFDFDHVAGMDEVLQPQRPFQLCYDRGNNSRSNANFVQSYVNAAGNRRRTPSVGQEIPLGGGAVLRVLALNGQVQGGATVTVKGTQQEENARSIAMRLDYGDFSMWIGGDLTGGGNGTADVETPASAQCGDVDVYIVNHHGSNTSTNATLASRLSPELSVFSAGSGNSFGHPQNNVINRLNRSAASTVLTSTTEGSGSLGFAVTGDLTISPDGRRYRARAQNGDFLDLFVDEVTGKAPSIGDLCISEIHRDPMRVPDANGEYLELTNISGAPVSLRGLRISTNSTAFTIAADVMLVPGRPLAVLRDGYPGRNGGLPIGLVSPFGALSLGNSSDTLSVRSGFVSIASVSYSGGFAGGSGVAAERRDLRGFSTASNFAAATRTYGVGELGTPGSRNTADSSSFPSTMVIDSVPGELTIHGASLSHGGAISVLGLAFSSQPGFSLFGTQIPLNVDPLLQLTFSVPGFVGSLPSEGYRSLQIPLPSPNTATGTPAYGAHLTLRLFPFGVQTLSPATPFVFP